MKIHHLRGATFIIEQDSSYILIDPALDPKGAFVPIAFFRHKPVRNPTVALPPISEHLLNKVTHVLITHLHPDHVDKTGIQF